MPRDILGPPQHGSQVMLKCQRPEPTGQGCLAWLKQPLRRGRHTAASILSHKYQGLAHPNLEACLCTKGCANLSCHLLALQVQAVEGLQVEAWCSFAPLQPLPQQEREPEDVLTLLLSPADTQK